MKKIAVVISVILMIALFAGSALGAELDVALVRLVDDGEIRPAATATMISVEGVEVLVTADVLQSGDALTVDGAEITAAWRLGSSGLILLQASDNWLEPWPLAGQNGPGGMALGCREDQAQIRVPLKHQAETDDLVVVTTETGLLPGAVLLDDGSHVYGVVLSSLGEGTGRYIALNRDGILNALLNAPREPIALGGIEGEDAHAELSPTPQPARETAEPAGANPSPTPLPRALETDKPLGESDGMVDAGPDFPEGVTVRYEDGFLYVDWPARLDGATILLADDANEFVSTLTTYAATPRTAAFVAVPGHEYAVWMTSVSPEQFDFSDEAACWIAVPEEAPMDRYGFHDEQLYLSVMTKYDYARIGDADLTPKTETFTREALRSGVLLLQAESHYVVEEEIRENLSAVLFAPDGSCYAAPLAAFAYIPGIMDEDVWHMDLSDCVSACDYWTGLPAGTYTVRYYIHGSPTGEVSFELE